MIDHKETPSGWWRVEEERDGTYRAEYHYGDDQRTIRGFPTRMLANLETWEVTPRDYLVTPLLAWYDDNFTKQGNVSVHRPDRETR